MSSQKVEWYKLFSYKRGELSQIEEREIEEWLAGNSDKEEILEFLDLSQTLDSEDQQDWDADSAWLRYKARFGRDLDRDRRAFPNRKRQKNEFIAVSSTFFKLTAAAVILFITGFIAAQFYTISNGASLTTEVEAKYGERTDFKMGDGTLISLNAGSKIRITETENGREVELNGEAFFDVVSDPDRPFKVITTRSVTEVLGTRFAVNAYPENNEVRVLVEHGKVMLNEKDGNTGKPGVELTENQMGIVTEHGLAQVQTIDSSKEYLGWRNGMVQFNNQPVTEVVAKIERVYDVTIELPNELNSFKNSAFTGTFSEEQQVTEVLDAITFVFNLDYQHVEPDSTYKLYQLDN